MRRTKPSLPTCERGVLAVIDDPTLWACKLLKAHAAALRWNFQSVGQYHEATKTLRDNPQWASKATLVFFCLDVDNIEAVPSTLRAWRKRTRIILYQRRRSSSGSVAVECVMRGAWDYLVDPDHEAVLQVHFDAAFSGRRPYARFRDLPPRRSGRRVFGAIPFTPEASNWLWDSAVSPAISAANLEPLILRDVAATGILSESVQQAISNSWVVVGDITPYDGIENSNVYFELGYAMGKGKYCVLLNRSPDPVPADLRGYLQCSYITDCDLALQLYWGFCEKDQSPSGRR